ncbi:MAG: 50S ribosomal protein L10 [Cytophagales bacterium]
MTKEKKGQVIEELQEKFKSYDFFYITDAAGMTVAQVNAFRRACFEKGLEYRVIKNTLIKKALEVVDCDYTSFEKQVLKGFSGVIFSKESGKLPATLLKEFYKSQKVTKPILKGASIDKGLFIGAETLDQLTKLKSKNEMIGEVIGLLQSPAKNVVSALQSAPNKLAGIVKTLQERGE